MTNTAPGRSNLQRLSPIPELDPREIKADEDSTGPSYAVDKCSTVSSSTNSLSDTQGVEGELNAYADRDKSGQIWVSLRHKQNTNHIFW